MTQPDTPSRIEIVSYDWPDVTAESNLVALLAQTPGLSGGAVLVLTSKVVSKAEGLVAAARRADAVDAETRRVVARKGATVIAETRHGLVMAAAGVDASNVPAGFVVTLPTDADESARRLRAGLYATTGCNVAVVVTDTAGRAWRNGQTDIAVGCAGLMPLVDLAGTLDTHGNPLSVTAPAVADELAAATDLVKGKTSGRPLAVVTGLEHRVLPSGESGPGAAALIRHRDDDLFGLGAREAVQAAVLRRDAPALAHFPRRTVADPEPFEGVCSDDEHVRIRCERHVDSADGGRDAGWVVQVDLHPGAGPTAWIAAGRLLERVDCLAAAHRLRHTALAPPVGSGPQDQVRGWRTVTRKHWVVA